MYCPECGADAGAGNFCPECGADLREAAASPNCAACDAEVPEGAKFCPECGEPTGAAAPARPAAAAASSGGRRTGTRGRSAGGGQQRQQRRQEPRARQGADSQTRQPGRVSPGIAWGVLGAVVVIAIVIVVLFARSSGGGDVAATTPAGTGSVQAVAADTSGSYDELVQRANGLYDQGSAKYQAKDYNQGAEYFLAASKVYAAAWKQKAGDPSVGTDYATSLFYSGDIDGAIRQVDKVLASSPDFQTAWFNKGNYLAERARQAEQNDSKAAKSDYAAAKVAYQKAVDLDPQSSSGQQAKQQLSDLPQ